MVLKVVFAVLVLHWHNYFSYTSTSTSTCFELMKFFSRLLVEAGVLTACFVAFEWIARAPAYPESGGVSPTNHRSKNLFTLSWSGW